MAKSKLAEEVDALEKAEQLGAAQADGKIMEAPLRTEKAYKQVVHRRQLCFHLSNRDLLLGNATEVPLLMCDIGSVGFSSKPCFHALCAEKQPGCNKADDKNRKWVEASAVPLVPAELHSINFLTLAVGHTT